MRPINCLIILLLKTSFLMATPVFQQHNTGKEFPVQYDQYGTFKNIGTNDYYYEINDDIKLADAVGDAIFPNNFTIYEDPAYKQLIKERRLVGGKWSFVNDLDIQACYFKWALIEDEEPGVKLFYTAYNLERAGLYQQAVKAYYACVVHFPKSVGWTYWNTPWYIGVKALELVEALLRENPEIGYTLVDAEIFIENGFDSDISNDIYTIHPGKLVKTSSLPKNEKQFGKIVKRLGGKNGEVVQFENGDWQFLLEGKPTLLKTISYQPAPVFQSHDEGTMADWMKYDSNGNGKPDSPCDSWVDQNKNGVQDDDEPSVGDFKIMTDMGANSIRIYHHATNKELLREAYEKYKLYVVQGDLLGMYCVGSGADWNSGTDYRDPVQQKNMLESVKKMVTEFKDEPYICMWVLGNENNYGGVFGHVGGAGNASQFPDVYYQFVNEAAKLIKSIDQTRPVAVCNGDMGFLDIFEKHCPDVDIFGPNAYRGSHGFGMSIWKWGRKLIDRPIMPMEYGCPAYHEGQNLTIGEEEQAVYNNGCWLDIEYNSYKGFGEGNAIGGVLFQWIDGWWKSGQPPRFSAAIQETMGQWPGPFPDGWSHEEWFGVCGQGNGTKTPFMRVLRKTYFEYQKLWTKE